MSCLMSPESMVWTCFCLSQPISPAHPRARNLPPGDRRGKECIQHAQHFHETLLIVDLPLEQVLETLQLTVHHWWLANYRTIDVKDHLGCYYQDRCKPAVSHIPGEERNKSCMDFCFKFRIKHILYVYRSSHTRWESWVSVRVPVHLFLLEHSLKFLFDPALLWQPPWSLAFYAWTLPTNEMRFISEIKCGPHKDRYKCCL